MIFGHNFWLECPMKVISTQLSYILKALFSDTPLALFFRATCHLATWSAKTIGKQGIPEKSIKNVAQLRWNYLRRTLQSKVIAENRVVGNRPLYFTLQKSVTQFQWKESYLSKTSFVTFFCIDIWHTKSECYCQNSKIYFLWTALVHNHGKENIDRI